MPDIIRTYAIAAGLILLAGSAAAQTGPASLEQQSIPLAGEWTFRPDPENAGMRERWFGQSLPDKIRVPGSTDEAGYGVPNTRKPNFDYLSRLVEYTGPAWYQREIDIPADWQGQRIILFLERCHWESRAWLDETELGMQDSLCVPHVFDLPAEVHAGKHRLTVRIDNTKKYNMGPDAHSVSEQTQTNWNGMIGRIELRATEPIWIEDVQIYPNLDSNTATVRLTIGNRTAAPAQGRLRLKTTSSDGQETISTPANVSIIGPSSQTEVEIKFSQPAEQWDEFNPVVYELAITLVADNGARIFSDQARRTFGMRKLSAEGRELRLNNRAAFLRGTLECCIFPLTGYPPMDTDAWARIFRIARSYGLNHMRFHSWCPPAAAFEAADHAGFLLHVEAPQWVFDVGQDAPRDAFIEQEVRRILKTYGNHPSFGMLCMGNELRGEKAFLKKLVNLGKQLDRRHLYTASTAWSFTEDDEYNVAVIRGLHGPTTDFDFREEVAKSRVPLISHEIGQWTVYPKLDEIKKYTGVLRARNFELIRDDLKARGRLEQAADFTLASGKLAVELYKEEIEVLLRTPGHAGFQLLDLHDFPGQGTALIGILDPFWDSKDLIEPAAFRRFCGPTVPLLRLKQRTFTTEETLATTAEIAHYGPMSLGQVSPVWTVKDASGKELAGGSFPSTDIMKGKLSELGKIELPLKSLPAPAKLTITVAIKDTEYANDWNIWLYPASSAPRPAGDVVVAENWPDAAAALDDGRKVLLLASPRILERSIPGSFTSVFWSPIWFQGGAGTMGILCDPKHPALAGFPTDAHTNWQWFDPLQRSRTMVLDGRPPGLRPIVQVIDNFSRNQRLANLFECRVGSGRLVVCSIDLQRELGERPAARQLRTSLLDYMNSDRFQPAVEIASDEIGKLFHEPLSLNLVSEVKGVETAVLHVKAAPRVDANRSRRWEAGADEVLRREPGYDYSVQGRTWRDSQGSGWHDNRELAVTITCPKGFEGRLYAHFHDWNKLGRVADVSFQGRYYGEIREYDGPGVWAAFEVKAADSAEGRLVLSAYPTQNNVMVTQIVLAK